MFCINCFQPATQVTNSRTSKKQALIWRRRHCRHCGHTFTTHETPSLGHNMMVHLASNRKTPFNSGRLILSISEAFHHTPDVAKEHSFALAKTVENILSTEAKLITTEEIAAVTHSVLRRFDELAGLQYAAKHQLISAIRKRRGRPSTSWHD